MNNVIYNIKDDHRNSSTLSLATLYDGFLRGNLFNNLYNPYKNYSYQKITASSKEEDLRYMINMYAFSLQDLDLYLDLNPNNQEALSLYQNYLKKLNDLVDEYNTQYMPLSLDANNLGDTTWKWVNSPWPWEVNK